MASSKSTEQVMNTPKTLPTTEFLSRLCREQRDRNVSKDSGLLREYEPQDVDSDILRNFRKEHGAKISQDALPGQKISEPRFYLPREFDSGSIISVREHTITVFIPIAPHLPHPGNPPTKVLYQHDKDNADVLDALPWCIGTPIQTFGPSLICVEKGPICFEMVQYDCKPVKDQESEGQDMEVAGR